MSSVPELAAPKGAQHCSSFSAVACDSAAYAKPLELPCWGSSQHPAKSPLWDQLGAHGAASETPGLGRGLVMVTRLG